LSFFFFLDWQGPSCQEKYGRSIWVTMDGVVMDRIAFCLSILAKMDNRVSLCHYPLWT
jgi:hypothetical protein